MHCALQTQAPHLHPRVMAKFNQRIFLENYFLHHGNHLLRMDDSHPQVSHQYNTSQWNSCSSLLPLHLPAFPSPPFIPLLPVHTSPCPWHLESQAAILPQNLCLPGEHLSVLGMEQRGEHNPGFLEGFWPPSSTCSCEQSTGFSSPIARYHLWRPEGSRDKDGKMLGETFWASGRD